MTPEGAQGFRPIAHWRAGLDAGSDHRTALVRLAGPICVQLLLGAVTGVIDVLWVAKLGAASVAAVAVATNLETVLLGVMLMASAGMTVEIARAVGAGDLGAVKALLRGGWLLWALITPPAAVGGFMCRRPLAGLLVQGAGAVPERLTADYLAVSLPGIAVLYAQNTVNAVFKATGDTRSPMHTAVLANVLVLLLDPVMIFGLAGMPSLGVRGAALATVIGRAGALLAAVAMLRGGQTLRAASCSRAGFAASAALARIVRPGLIVSGEFLIRTSTAMALVTIVAPFGAAAVAAFGIDSKVISLVTLAFYALRQAGAIHTARTLGAGCAESVAIRREAVRLGAAFGGASGLVLVVAAPGILRVFTGQSEVVALGAGFLRILAVGYLVPLGCVLASAGVVQGAGRTVSMVAVALVGGVVQVLGGRLAVRVPWIGADGVVVAMAASMLLQAWLVCRRAVLTR